MGSFADAVAAFAGKVPGAAEAVFRASAQDIAEQIQLPVAKGGNMRVDTGFLRNSMQASLTSFPAINPNARPPADAAPGSFPENLDQVNLVIASAKLDDTINIGFTASYARPREYHDGFVRLSVQRWEEIVNANAAKVRALIG